MAEPLVVTRDTAPEPLNLVGEKLTVLASGEQTGSYEVFHQAGPEGSGPPPHNHPWDEAFYVIRGEIAFGIGTSRSSPSLERWFTCRQGRRTGSASVRAAAR